MEINKELKDKYSVKQKKSPYLHSADHALADELSLKLGEPKRFGMYLKMAVTNSHPQLRKILGQVLEGGAKNPGALFVFLLKQEKKNAKEATGAEIKTAE